MLSSFFPCARFPSRFQKIKQKYLPQNIFAYFMLKLFPQEISVVRGSAVEIKIFPLHLTFQKHSIWARIVAPMNKMVKNWTRL